MDAPNPSIETALEQAIRSGRTPVLPATPRATFMKRCASCRREKLFEMFNRSSQLKDGHHSYCRDCVKQKRDADPDRNTYKARWRLNHLEQARAQTKRSYWKNRDKKLLGARKAHLKRRYGITFEDYIKILELQGNRCAICGRMTGKRRLAVDHNHQNGKVRGLLCNCCNRGLGAFGDNPESLLAAIDYLRKSKL